VCGKFLQHDKVYTHTHIGGWVGLWQVRNISTRYQIRPTKLFI